MKPKIPKIFYLIFINLSLLYFDYGRKPSTLGAFVFLSQLNDLIPLHMMNIMKLVKDDEFVNSKNDLELYAVDVVKTS